MLKTIWNKIPEIARVPLLIGIVLIGGLLTFMYGAKAVNWTSRAVFKRGNVVITKEIQKDLDDAAASKQLTQELLIQQKQDKAEIAKTKEAYANDKQKLQLAEQVLADKSKTTDQKLKAYQDAVNRAPTIHVAPESTDEQCARATALGLDLAICH